MSLRSGALEVAEKFARAVIRRKWTDILPLLTTTAQVLSTADRLAAEFDWKHLEPRLRLEFTAKTGVAADEVVLDPPKRFEVFEVEERASPANHDASIPVSWVEVDFQPSVNSEFDVCYNCFLAFIDEDGPRITAYAIEEATE